MKVKKKREEKKSGKIEIQNSSKSLKIANHRDDINMIQKNSLTLKGNVDHVDRKTFFEELQKRLQKCVSYEDLQVEVIQCLPQVQHFKVDVFCDQSIVELKGSIDSLALDLLPKDVKSGLYPMRIYGDGNCLPRCGEACSNMSHTEVRVRIVIEGVSHESLYLDNSFLSKGLQKRKENLPSLFAQYSEEYDPSAQLTPLGIKRIYEAEQLKIIHNSCYMGIWQIFSLASVLQHRVISVYPSYGGQIVRQDLNRQVQPRKFRNDQDECTCIYIMWSHINGRNLP
uniref:Vertnin n=1 Tax=Crassostrea virginica TaxID=6565 RepID=A0A8B8B4Z1_CRAVI|nr:vertnin-like [Crassostrea virginica]